MSQGFIQDEFGDIPDLKHLPASTDLIIRRSKDVWITCTIHPLIHLMSKTVFHPVTNHVITINSQQVSRVLKLPPSWSMQVEET